MSEPTYPQVERRAATDAHWTFKKEIQLTHVISTVLLAVSAWGYISNMEKRIAIMEDKILAQRERDEKQDLRYKEGLEHISNQVDRMDSKLDRLIERKSQ